MLPTNPHTHNEWTDKRGHVSRTYPVVHGGTFRTEREAKLRRDMIAGEIAAGRNPADLLRALLAPPVQKMKIADWSGRFLASRVDFDVNTRKNYTSTLKRISERFGDRDPAALTAADVAAWIAELSEVPLKPSAIQLHVITLRLLLDFTDVEPNVARDPRVKLPKRVREEPKPPPADHFEAILSAVGPKWRLLFITVEQGVLRVGEAVSLRWGDVDAGGLRLRLPRSATKRDSARWVYLPEWLMEAIQNTCPPEDRVPERKVFPGISEASAYQAMTRACTLAQVPHYHPHDLRHRRITIWHQSGVPARELAERAGHAKPSMSLDVYSHVMPADEVPMERLTGLIGP